MEISKEILSERDRCIKIIEEEPEFSGLMPDEIWNIISSNREAATFFLQLTVKLTKENIVDRILSNE